MNRTPETEQIFYIISSIRRSAYKIIEDELHASGAKGLMYTHGSILYAIYRNGGRMKLSDIAALINRRKPTVTVLVDKLEEHGYVIRRSDEKDSRICMVHVTDKGMLTVEAFKSIENTLRKKALKGFHPADEKHLMSLLGRIYSNLKE